LKSTIQLIKFAGLNVLNMKTKTLKISEIEKNWWIADADSQVLGRLASKIAQILKGKHKVNYVPHLDNGDCVVVINAEKIVVTGNKEEQKTYFRHTGYVGGVKTTSLAHLRRTYPERIIEKAVKGMLPHNKLGRRMFLHLKVYSGTKHPHEAQSPQTLEL
jgi:large subunit ribosomal protein L13